MNAILETGISLVLIFFIFSTITYVIQEMIAVNLKFRSKMLWKSISQLLDGFQLEGRTKLMKALPTTTQTPVTNDFYNHPEICSLHNNLKRQPSYIPAANFALAIMNMVAAKAPVKQNKLFEDFQAGLQTFVNSKGNLFKVLQNLLDTSANIKELQEKIEAWFNSYMQRVTGWYESHTVLTVRLIAVALALIFNINVIKLAKTIYNNGQLRSGLVALADNVVDHPETVTRYYSKTFDQQNASLIQSYDQKIAAADSSHKEALQKEKADTLDKLAAQYTGRQLSAIDTLTAKLKATGLPLGWKCDTWKKDVLGDNKDFWGMTISFLIALMGWIIGAGCISMGAPFWFDLLNKLVNVRRSGVKPAK